PRARLHHFAAHRGNSRPLSRLWQPRQQRTDGAMTRLLEARGIELARNGRSILEAVDLAIRDGEVVTLIGPNGSGKTSLLRILLGLQRPDAGEVIRKPG